MVTVLGLWESDWMDAERTERRLWKQTIEAFAVDTWAMVPQKGGPFTSPIQYATAAEMLAAHPGPKVFLMMPESSPAGAVRLRDFVHPAGAIYVLGNGHEDLASYVQEGDQIVSIETPQPAALFACAALSAVLFDRLAKE